MKTESLEDAKITSDNIKLHSLTEHPVWGVFVKMLVEDLNALDSITSLDVANLDRDALAREVEVRYHTIKAIETQIATTIERANTAKLDIIEESETIIKRY